MFFMEKKRILYYLSLFGFSYYNENLINDKSYDIKNIKNCKLCNLYKTKHNFYENLVKKSKIFILSSSNLDLQDVNNFNDILKKSLNLTLSNIFFTSLVKCSNDYKNENIKICFNYFLNEFIESEANILILLGENLKNLLYLDNFFVGEKIFYNFNNKKIKVLINYDFYFIKKNPSYEKDFINNLNKLKDDI